MSVKAVVCYWVGGSKARVYEINARSKDGRAGADYKPEEYYEAKTWPQVKEKVPSLTR